MEEPEGAEKHPEPKHKPEKLEKKISETFFYNYEDLCSRPFVTSDSGIPSNLLVLMYPSYPALCGPRTRVFIYEVVRPFLRIVQYNQKSKVHPSLTVY